MVLPTKIYINFHTQVFNTFSRLIGMEIIDFEMSGKTSDTIKYLPESELQKNGDKDGLSYDFNQLRVNF